MFKIFKKRGFSMAELMVVLLLVSLLLAAMIPIVTKKHLALPKLSEHGSYMCYYQGYDADGNPESDIANISEYRLHEKRTNNPFGNQQNTVFDRDVDNCVFTPPKKAVYFQISAVGGGGGGGDSGYNGGNINSGWTGIQLMSPFGLTEKKLQEAHIIYNGKNYFSGSGDVDQLAGTLYAYAKSEGSGEGGDAHLVQCERICEKYDDEKMSDPGKTSRTYTYYPCEGDCTCPEGSTKQQCSVYITYYTYETSTTGCTSSYTCDSPCTYTTSYSCPSGETLDDNNRCCSTETKCPAGKEKKESKTEYGCYDTKTGNSGNWSSQPTTQESCNANGNTRYSPTSRTVEYTVGCNVTPEPVTTCTGATSSRSCSCSETEHKYCPKVAKYHYEPYQYTCCKNSAGGITSDPVTSTIDLPTGGYGGYTPKQCSADGYEVSYSYYNGYGGGAAGNGVKCRSAAITYNNAYNLPAPVYSSNAMPGYKGTSMTPMFGDALGYHKSATYISDENGKNGAGGIYCLDANGELSNADTYAKNGCGSWDKTPRSVTRIGGYTAFAYNARSSGKGASLETMTYMNENYTDSDKNDKCEIGKFYNEVTPGLSGTNGKCDSDYNSVPVSGSFCHFPDYIKNGYCLVHKKNNYDYEGITQYESGYEGQDASYRFRYSFDENYLTYGNAGSAGEIKTIVVRSFKDMDTTIKIGRGGSGAVLGSGSYGMNGSATSMGKVITAKGGDGGAGSLVGTVEVMPGYDATEYSKQLDCFNKTYSILSKNECIAAYESDNNSYTFIKTTGAMQGQVAKLGGLASNLFNFIMPKKSDSYTTEFNEFGKGGSGGGVVHKCWAGQFIVWFEGEILAKNSIFPTGGVGTKPDGTTLNRGSNGYELPSSCQTNYALEAAKDGIDGAILIKW